MQIIDNVLGVNRSALVESQETSETTRKLVFF